MGDVIKILRCIGVKYLLALLLVYLTLYVGHDLSPQFIFV